MSAHSSNPKIETENMNDSSSYPIPPMHDVYVDDRKDVKGHPVLGNSCLDASEQVRRIKEYRQNILSNYQPVHPKLFRMNASSFFVPSFLKAITENTKESFQNIISEPSPGILTFEMLQPEFCRMLINEFKNFEKWSQETRFRIRVPNTMYKHGVVLDDFGMETMLDKLMKDFILPMSTVFFPEVGGATLDSHHAFIVGYGTGRDNGLGFHVDDSEITLNVSLGEKFSGGNLFFRGVRCGKHVNGGCEAGEIFDYAHVPGQAVLHRGCHRHGALSTTSGHRVNMLVWCMSSVFRKMSTSEKMSPRWCRVCQSEKKERQRLTIASIRYDRRWKEADLLHHGMLPLHDI